MNDSAFQKWTLPVNHHVEFYSLMLMEHYCCLGTSIIICVKDVTSPLASEPSPNGVCHVSLKIRQQSGAQNVSKCRLCSPRQAASWNELKIASLDMKLLIIEDEYPYKEYSGRGICKESFTIEIFSFWQLFLYSFKLIQNTASSPLLVPYIYQQRLLMILVDEIIWGVFSSAEDKTKIYHTNTGYG